MSAWLICESCGCKELILPTTSFDGGCKYCGGIRSRTEDDDGKPLIAWSNINDFLGWMK